MVAALRGSRRACDVTAGANWNAAGVGVAVMVGSYARARVFGRQSHNAAPPLPLPLRTPTPSNCVPVSLPLGAADADHTARV